MLSNIFANASCRIIKYSGYSHFTQDISMFRALKSSDDFTRILVPSDVDHLRLRWAEDLNVFDISKSRFATFSMKVYILTYIYNHRLFVHSAESVQTLLNRW